MNKHMQYSLAVTFALLLSLGVSGCAKFKSGSAPQSIVLADVLALKEQLPAPNSQEANAVYEQFLASGPQGIAAICARLAPSDQGGDVGERYLIGGLAKYMAPGQQPEERRQMVCEAYLKAMAQAASPEVKQFLIEQVELMAGDESVQPLAGLLGDETLNAAAVRALLAIGSQSAQAALLEALPASQGHAQLTLVNAMGTMKCEAARPQLRKLAKSQDKALAWAALHALSAIGHPGDAAMLKQSAQVAQDPYSKGVLMSDLFLYAQRLTERGEKAQSKKICRAIYDGISDAGQLHLRAGALSLLVQQSSTAQANRLLLEAFDSSDIEFRGAVLELAATLKGAGVTRPWTEKLQTVEPPVRVEIIRMLGKRGDAVALAAIRRSIADTDPQVHEVALKEAVHLGQNQMTQELLEMLISDDPVQCEQARALLLQVADPALARKAGGLFETASAQGQVELLDQMALRRTRKALPLFMMAAQSQDKKVRLAALKGLRDVATARNLERLFTLYTQSQSKSEAKTARETLISIANQTPATQAQCLDLIQATLAASDQQCYNDALALLPLLATAPALEEARARLVQANAEQMDGAARAIIDWPDAAALEDVLAIADDAKAGQTLQVLALRSYARMVGQKSDLTAQARYDLYVQGMDRVQDKQELVPFIGGLANVADPRVLDKLLGFVSDEALQNETAVALVNVCKQLVGQYPDKVRQAMDAIKDVTLSEAVRNDRLAVLDALSAPKS